MTERFKPCEETDIRALQEGIYKAKTCTEADLCTNYDCLYKKLLL